VEKRAKRKEEGETYWSRSDHNWRSWEMPFSLSIIGVDTIS
jgi:hypothetical protein